MPTDLPNSKFCRNERPHNVRLENLATDMRATNSAGCIMVRRAPLYLLHIGYEIALYSADTETIYKIGWCRNKHLAIVMASAVGQELDKSADKMDNDDKWVSR
jgi:hypothetical protein